MTFEEKIKELQQDTVVNSTRYWDKRLKNLNSESARNFSTYTSASFSNLVQYVVWGDIENTKKEVDRLTPIMPLLKKALRLYNQYKGCKRLKSYGNHVLEFDSVGSLAILEVVNAENLLFWSRLLRDAEKKCLQHPRHK